MAMFVASTVEDAALLPKLLSDELRVPNKDLAHESYCIPNSPSV